MTVQPEFQIAQCLPHEGRMLLLDELLERRDDAILTALIIRSDSVFCDGVTGVPAWAGMEYMAQAACAFSGVDQALAGEWPSISLLLGTRSYHARVAIFPLGARLIVSAQLLVCDDDDLMVFACSIRDAVTQAELATGDIKAIRPENIHALIKEQLHG